MNLANQAADILRRSETEKREMSGEEQTQFDAIHADIDKLKGQIDRVERQEREELEQRGSQGRIGGGLQDGGNGGEGHEQRTAEEAKVMNDAAFRSFLVYGMSGLSPEHRQVMASRMANLPDEARAQAIGTDTAGGYTATESFAAQVETAMKAYAGIRNTRATIIRTSTGSTMNMPTSNDTSNKGARLGENTQVGEQDITFGSKALRSYTYNSKLVRVSLQFMRDTNMANFEGWLAERLGERIGRILGEECITGTGNNMPEGLAAATSAGVTCASATAITYDEFVNMEHAINPAYRRQAEWLLADGLVKAAKLLKDGEGRPLWVPGIASNAPDTILRYRYTVDQEIPTPASNALSGYFGDFSKFHIRDVGGLQVLRLTERYADYLQVGFIGFSSHDSVLLDAGTNPIKHIKMGA